MCFDFPSKLHMYITVLVCCPSARCKGCLHKTTVFWNFVCRPNDKVEILSEVAFLELLMNASSERISPHYRPGSLQASQMSFEAGKGKGSDIKQRDLYITSLLTFSQYCTRISDALRLSHNNTHPTYS